MRFYNFADYHKQLLYISEEFFDFKVSDGDLCQIGDIYILCLGQNIWPELDKSEYIYNLSDNTKIEYTFNLLSKSAMQIVHWIVRRYFTSYRNAVGLYIADLGAVIKYKPADKKSPKKSKLQQKLYIYGDVWSIDNSKDIKDIASLDESQTRVIKTHLTHVQQAKIFWDIKLGKIANIVCTHSLIWQDWNNLSDIYIYDERKWYYKNQQDPRYQTAEVVEKMKEAYIY